MKAGYAFIEKLVVTLIVITLVSLSSLAQTAGYTNWNTLTNWTETTAPSSEFWHSIACSADATHLFASYDGGIYISTDSGGHWNPGNVLVRDWRNVACSADGTNVVATEGTGTIYFSTNAGGFWTQAKAPLYSWQDVVSSADGTTMVACESGHGGIYISTDSGATWNISGAPTNSPVSWMTWACVASSADGTKLAATSGYGIYTSTNSGTTWTQCNVSSPVGFGPLTSSSDGTNLAAVSYYGTYVSTNAGFSWTNTSALASTWWHLTGSANGAILAGFENATELLSTNGGNSWLQVTTPFENAQAAALSGDGTTLAIVDGYGGIWLAHAQSAPSVVAPGSVTASTGRTILLSANLSGTSPLVCHWAFNGAPISGATNTTLTISNVYSGNVGRYAIVVSNSFGSVTSHVATLASVDAQISAGLPAIVINGPVKSNYVIEASADLSGSWTPLTNVALPSQPYTFIDQRALASPQFYRAVPQ